jgi:hypothetical protein
MFYIKCRHQHTDNKPPFALLLLFFPCNDECFLSIWNRWSVVAFKFLIKAIIFCLPRLEREQWRICASGIDCVYVSTILDHTDGVMVNVLASSAVDCSFDPRSGQSKGYDICICHFSAKWAIFQPYHGENMLNINEMMMSVLY